MNDNSLIKETYIEGNGKSFEVIKIIGQTDFAKVYKAQMKDSDEIIAIKVYDKNKIRNFLQKKKPKKITENDVLLFFEKIYNEIDNMKKIESNKSNHNTVKFYESFDNDKELGIIMEYCDDNFAKFFTAKRALNSNKIYEILNLLNNSFKIMSEINLIHRAINLENILVKYLDQDKKKYVVKLKLTEDSIFLNQLNTKKNLAKIVGNLKNYKYFAPEILNGDKYNEKCDLWSLGVVIYELYFKELPFDGKNQIEILNNINDNFNNFLNKLKTGNDSELNDLILKLVNPTINQRYDWNQYFNHPFFRKKERCEKFYELKEEIGSTDFATIYKARNLETNELRAIKIYDKNKIRMHLGSDEEMQSYNNGFYKEMEIMKVLQGHYDDNINTVKFYEYFDNNDEFASVMELCDDNLQNIFINSESFDSEKILDLLNQLNNSFQIMNENKIVHRALNLENILVKYIDKEKSKFIYKLKITNDSDWLRNLQRNNNFAKINGLINFVAPEILNGKKCDLNCDLWSLGVIIYVLYFQEYPYNGDMEQELLNDIKNIKKNFKKASDSNINDLIQSLLTFNQKERITWEEYFRHPFLKNIKKGPKRDFRKYYDNLVTIGFTEYASVCKANVKGTNEIRAIKIHDLNKYKGWFKAKYNRIPEKKDLQPYINKFHNEIKHMQIIEGRNKDNKFAVKFYDSFENENELVIAMELGDENLLSNKLNRNKFFSPKEIGSILRQLNVSFKIMHENNIVHRAVNLETILVKYSNKERTQYIVKLLMTDDSISLDDLKNNISFGNPSENKNYLAPEILENKNYNEKCDLWSLGVAIYVLYFKDFPYKGEKEEEILNNIKKIGQNFQKISDENLDNLIRNLLVVNVEKRYGWEQYFQHPFFSNNQTIVY